MRDFVTIGDAANRPDYKTGRGCVAYEYDLAKCQISNSDWCDFLNIIGEAAAIDRKLFHHDMEKGVLGGLCRTSDAGMPFRAKPGWEKKPLVYVSYPSLLKYCNWCMTGKLDDGAYDLATMPPRRREGAIYFLPNADEWYKAAYWDPKKRCYYRYPTGSDAEPSVSEANFEKGDSLAVGKPFYFADVDDGSLASSPFGVLQMGGNAWEFIENVWARSSGQYENTLRGGSFGYTETGLDKSNTDVCPYGGISYVFGARIAFAPLGWHSKPMPIRYKLILRARKCLATFARKFR